MPVLDRLFEELSESREIRQRSEAVVQSMNDFMDQHLREEFQLQLAPTTIEEQSVETNQHLIRKFYFKWQTVNGTTAIVYFNEKGKPGSPCRNLTLVREVGQAKYWYWAAENEYGARKTNCAFVNLHDKLSTELYISVAGGGEPVVFRSHNESESILELQKLIPDLNIKRLKEDKSYRAEVVELIKNKLFE